MTLGASSLTPRAGILYGDGDRGGLVSHARRFRIIAPVVPITTEAKGDEASDDEQDRVPGDVVEREPRVRGIVGRCGVDDEAAGTGGGIVNESVGLFVGVDELAHSAREAGWFEGHAAELGV